MRHQREVVVERRRQPDPAGVYATIGRGYGGLGLLEATTTGGARSNRWLVWPTGGGRSRQEVCARHAQQQMRGRTDGVVSRRVVEGGACRRGGGRGIREGR